MAVDATVALVSLVNAKIFLKITGSSEDSLIEQLIDRMSWVARKYCGCQFVSTSFTEFYDGDGSDTLVLRNYPIISVSNLYDDPLRSFGSGTEIVVADNVIINKGAGIISLWNSYAAFNEGKKNVKIVYTAGFATIPYDIQHAVMLMILHAYKRHYSDQKIGVSSESVGDRQFTYSERDIPKPAAGILNNYRRRGWEAIGLAS